MSRTLKQAGKQIRLAEVQIVRALSAVICCAFADRELHRLDDLGISATAAQIT